MSLDDVTGSSQLMLLPGTDAQYRISVSVIGKEGDATGQGGVTPSQMEITSEEKVFRTLPYVNCEYCTVV